MSSVLKSFPDTGRPSSSPALPESPVPGATPAASPHKVTDSDRVAVKSSRRLIFLSLGDMEWIEADGNYVQLHVGDDCYRIREKISSVADAMDEARFVRIHRSVIVNLDRVHELQPCGGGEYVVVLESGKQLPVGRSYKSRLRTALRDIVMITSSSQPESDRVLAPLYQLP
jgi:two-component system LytT family response regulator